MEDSDNFVWIVAGGGIVVAIVLSLWMGQKDDKLAGDAAANEQENKPAAAMENSVADRFREATDPRRISEARAERARRIQESPEEYYDPNNRDMEYREKVAYHNQVKRFLTSTRHDDPRYRKIMSQLLEYGYGLEEWIHVVQCLLEHNAPVLVHQKAMRVAGFAEWEIEEAINTDNPMQGTGRWMQMQDYRHDSIYRDFGFSAGITNRALIDGFLELDMLDVKEGEKLLGEDSVTTLPGDRLLTDADWLDEEFLAAKAKYQGRPKDHIDIRVDRAMGVPEEIIQQEEEWMQENLLKAVEEEERNAQEE